jgi:hypothetical protein
MAGAAFGRCRDELTVMPRPLRVEFAGAIYHLISRGDQAIFRDDEDRQTLLRTLAEACEKTG